MAVFNIELLRFVLVGIGSNVINYAIYLFAYSIGSPLFAASAAGYMIGLLCSYHFARIWVFGRKFRVSKRNISRFMIVYVVGGLGMCAIIEALVRTSVTNYQIGWFVGAIFAVINNYLGLKILVFNQGVSE